MRTQSILTLLVCFLLSCSFTLPLLACECDPACEGCESCEAGVCVDDPDNCISCQNCVDAECVDDDDLCDGCETCSNGYCDDDDDECSTCKECVDGDCVLKATSDCDVDSDCTGECHKCSSCSCVSDESKCADCMTCIAGDCFDIQCTVLGECERCNETIGECESTCDPDKCCDNNICVDKCDPDGGATCTWTNPPVVDPLCTYLHEGNRSCRNPGDSCNWTVVEGPGKNATCASCAPDCTTSTYCVKLKPIVCKTVLSPWPPFIDCILVQEHQS